MSDDAAPIHDSIDLGAPASSEPTTPHGATEQQLESELAQQEAGLKESDPQLYDRIQQEEAAALSAAQKDPARQSEIDDQFLGEAAQQVAAVAPTLGSEMEAEVAALDSLTGGPEPSAPTHVSPPARSDPTQPATPTTPTTVVAAEAQFVAANPAVVGQIEQVEADETQAIADDPGMAAAIEQQGVQEILGDVSKVDPELASALEGELLAAGERDDQAALTAEEQRIQERLSEPAP